MTSIHSRYATPSDAPDIATLASQVFAKTYGSAIPHDTLTRYLARVFTAKAVAGEFESQQCEIVLTHDKHHLIGMCKLRARAAPVAAPFARPLEIVQMYIAHSHHRNGIGSTLMRAAITHAHTHAHDGIWLCVWQQNLRALHFYQHWHFYKIGETKIMVDEIPFEDDVMARAVDSNEQ